MKVVIMAGGSGTRFWPWSVEEKPKQFIALTSTETMIQQTYRRFRQWLPKKSIFVVTTKQYLHLVLEQLQELEREQLIVEPEQRDTGPCIALTASYFIEKGEDEVLVTAPSDQYIPDDKALMEALLQAEQIAHTDHAIVTLGVVPTRPETGYGYMQTENAAHSERIYKVKSFIEKPPEARAKALIRQKNVFWNSGIFIWRPSTIAYYMKAFQPQIWKTVNLKEDDLKHYYATLPKISVDYAILEKAGTIYMIPVEFEWDDVGFWTSLERIFTADSAGNIVSGNVLASSTSNSIIISETQKTVVIGAEDLIIVSTSEGLLICHKTKEQYLKHILQTNHQHGGGRQ